MKSAIKKLIKEELKSMIIEKARMSSKFRKAMEALYDVEYEQQELRKKFVAEKNPAKKEAMKKDLIALHKRVKAVQADFNKALSTEPVGDMDESKDLKEDEAINEGDNTKFTWKEIMWSLVDMGMAPDKISNIRRALKHRTKR
jgi:hypothetical protein